MGGNGSKHRVRELGCAGYVSLSTNNFFKKGRWADGFGWLFLIELGFAPTIYGANIALAWGINGLVFGFLLTLFAALYAVSRRPFPVPVSRFSVPVGMFGAVLLWIFLQVQTWLPPALYDPAWQEAGEMLGRSVPGVISVNPDATRLGLLRLATEATVFFLAMQFGRDPRWATRIVIAVAIAGTFYAVFAMLFKALGPELSALILPRQIVNPVASSALRGPFINRDHFAIYLGLASVCAWAALAEDIRRRITVQGFHSDREILAQVISDSAGLVQYAVLLMPLMVTLLLTTSRAGVLLTIVAVLIVAGLATSSPSTASARRSTARHKTRHISLLLTRAAPMAIAVLGIILALAAHGDTLAGRLAGGSFQVDVQPRLAVAHSTMRAIQDRPLLGYGYGTFPYIFPLYRDEAVPPVGRWLEAHNSYFEALLGLGVPVALILFAALATIVLSCVRGVLARKRDRLAPIAAVAATFIIALHALVDFSIQIEGIALTYAALLGAGFAQSWSSRTN